MSPTIPAHEQRAPLISRSGGAHPPESQAYIRAPEARIVALDAMVQRSIRASPCKAGWYVERCRHLPLTPSRIAPQLIPIFVLFDH
jgi:hypothetical protein